MKIICEFNYEIVCWRVPRKIFNKVEESFAEQVLTVYHHSQMHFRILRSNQVPEVIYGNLTVDLTLNSLTF